MSVYKDFLPKPGDDDSFISIGILCLWSIAIYPYLLRFVDVVGNWTHAILPSLDEELDIARGFDWFIK